MPRTKALRATPAAATHDDAVDPDRVRDDSAHEAAPDTRASADIAVLPVTRASAVEVMLDRCFVDERNPRRDAAVENVDELAATIEAVGLLQPLIGVDLNGLGIGILGGRRRLAALLKLQAAGKWGKTVPVILRADDGDLTTVAVAEQTQRVALSPAQEARAFARMLADARAKLKERHGASDDIAPSRGDAVASIAKAFGVGARHVEQRLTLAELHPPILDALDAGEIDLDAARAYARADAALQAKVWDAQGARAPAFTIKQALAKATLDAGDPIAVFVGEAAYVAAGGQVVRDFFGAEDDGAWADRKLAVKLAEQKLADEKARVEAEGWAFVMTMTKEPNPYDWKKATGAKRKATDAEQQTLKEIAARQKAIAKEERAIYDADEESTVEGQRRLAALEQENNALDDKAQAIEDGLVEYDVKARAKAGVVIYITDSGAMRVWRGVSEVDRTAHLRAASGSGAKATSKPKPEAEPEITRDTREALATHAAGLIAHALTPRAALAMLAMDLAAAVFAPMRQVFAVVDGDQLVKPRRPFVTTQDAARDIEHARWRDALKPHWKKPGAVEAEIATWSIEELLRLITFCVGACYDIDFGWSADAASMAEDTARVRAFSADLRIDPGAAWTPTLDVMKGFSTKALLGFCAELGVNAAANAPKAELAAMVADKAAVAKWTPPIVRDLCGATWTPPAAANAPKKRGRPSKADLAARAEAADAAPKAADTSKADTSKAAKPKQRVARKSAAKGKAT